MLARSRAHKGAHNYTKHFNRRTAGGSHRVCVEEVRLAQIGPVELRTTEVTAGSASGMWRRSSP
jgi:hypothetical protein